MLRWLCILSISTCVLTTFSSLSSPLLGDVTLGGGRPVVVRTPPSYDPAIPAAFIVVLHPYHPGPCLGGFTWGLDGLAAAEGLLFAAPAGTLNSRGFCYWTGTDACCGPGTPDDSSYLRSVIEEAMAAPQLNVDRDRIYVVGSSNGGFLAHRLACEHADLIAAAVSWAGVPWDDPARCTPDAPVHILQIHGTADAAVPFSGGGTLNGARMPGALETVERWAALNGCSLKAEQGEPLDLETSLPGNETRVHRYRSLCSTGGSAELWAAQGAGHGHVQGTRLAGKHILDYLLAHPKRPAPVASFEATPEEGTGPLEVAFNASASSAPEGTEIARYLWDFGDSERAEGIRAAHTYSEPGRYVVSLRVLTADGRVSVPERQAVQIHCDSEDIAPWRAADIGDPVFPGGALLESSDGEESLVVCAGGEGLRGADDQFFFVFQEVTGDFRLSAHLVVSGTGILASGVGLMVRASDDEGAAFGASSLETQRSGTRFRMRSRADSGVDVRFRSGERNAESSGWLRIERRNQKVTALGSIDGETWSRTGEREVTLPDAVLVGVAAFGRDAGGATPFQPLRSEISTIELTSLAVSFRRGDCNDDGEVNLSDAVRIFSWLFRGETAPACVAAANIDGLGDVNLTDPIYLLTHLFRGGPPPPAPFRECGISDRAADRDLGCEMSNCP